MKPNLIDVLGFAAGVTAIAITLAMLAVCLVFVVRDWFKESKFKKWLTGLNVLLFLAAPAVLAQTNPVTVTVNGTNVVITPPTPTTSPESFLVQLFGIHDASKNWYTNNITLEFNQSAVIDSAVAGTEQASRFGIWKSVDTSTEIGFDGEVDSLGIGSDVNAAYGHFKIRADWDNVAGGIEVGGGRQIQLETYRGEVGIFGEYQFIRGVGAKITWDTGYQDKANSNGKKIYTRILAGLTFQLGK